MAPEDMFISLGMRLSQALAFDGPWAIAGWQITLLDQRRAGYTPPLEADFVVAKDGVEARVALSLGIHPSGWIVARVVGETLGEYEFFLEQAYEEFEIWPPGSPCIAIDSGRMGKRCGWVQLEAEFWPQFAALADGRFITLERLDKER